MKWCKSLRLGHHVSISCFENDDLSHHHDNCWVVISSHILVVTRMEPSQSSKPISSRRSFEGLWFSSSACRFYLLCVIGGVHRIECFVKDVMAPWSPQPTTTIFPSIALQCDAQLGHSSHHSLHSRITLIWDQNLGSRGVQKALKMSASSEWKQIAYPLVGHVERIDAIPTLVIPNSYLHDWVWWSTDTSGN